MSKESYARGFCKAAEAAGVDPTALAKYAQQYKTEGYSPIGVIPTHEPVDIPEVWGGVVLPNRSSQGRFLVNPMDMEELPNNAAERVRRIINPRHLAWHQAHTNALSKATAPLREANFPKDSREVPLDIQRAIEKIYHDTMKSTTSAPPARVSVPAKK